MTRPSLRALALVAAPIAALVLASAPAVAAPTITVTGLVTDRDGTPLEGISVYGWSGDLDVDLEELDDEEDWYAGSEADLGDTDDEGRFSYSTRLGAGDDWGYGFTQDEWTFAFWDGDEDAVARFAPTELTKTLTVGRNSLGTVQLAPGATITGTLHTPAGKPIDAASVLATQTTDVYDAEAATSSTKGAFRLNGLAAGTYRFGTYFETDMDEPTLLSHPAVSVAEGATRADVALVSKVPCTRSLTVSSPKKKTATLTIKSTAKDFGLTAPGGTVTVKRGSKTVKSGVKLSTTSSSTSLTLGSQPTGKQTYKVSYTSGDCSGWSAVSKSVTVKKK